MTGEHADVGNRVDFHLERLCDDGCFAVRGYISTLEQGGAPPGCELLESRERALLLDELQAIMAVYEGPCEIP